MNFTISEFKLNLNYESWEVIFNENDVDGLFNCFLNTYLRIFYHSFPLKIFIMIIIIKLG